MWNVKSWPTKQITPKTDVGKNYTLVYSAIQGVICIQRAMLQLKQEGENKQKVLQRNKSEFARHKNAFLYTDIVCSLTEVTSVFSASGSRAEPTP
jgi:hypothetical protein